MCLFYLLRNWSPLNRLLQRYLLERWVISLLCPSDIKESFCTHVTLNCTFLWFSTCFLHSRLRNRWKACFWFLESELKSAFCFLFVLSKGKVKYYIRDTILSFTTPLIVNWDGLLESFNKLLDESFLRTILSLRESFGFELLDFCKVDAWC